MSMNKVRPIRAEAPAEPDLQKLVITAKSIVQAVIAARESGALDGENYDPSYPLWQAVELLEQVTDELDRRSTEAK